MKMNEQKAIDGLRRKIELLQTAALSLYMRDDPDRKERLEKIYDQIDRCEAAIENLEGRIG